MTVTAKWLPLLHDVKTMNHVTKILDRLWRLDDRVYESRLGWLMPGGVFWKLGRRDSSGRERIAPYFLGFTEGWFYNAARARSAREARAQEQVPSDK
jgi:hypothetical protein